MGNRALRSELNKLLKERGLGRLYKGKRKYAVVHDAHNLRTMIARLKSAKVKSIVSDCNVFNCEVARIETCRLRNSHSGLLWFRVIYTNGEMSCYDDDICFCDHAKIWRGLGIPWEEIVQHKRPLTIEEIRKRWGSIIAAIRVWAPENRISPFYLEIERRLAGGMPICDANGCCLPELEFIKTLKSSAEE